MKHLSGVDKTSWCYYELSLHAKFSPRCYYVLRFVFFVCVLSIKSMQHQNKAASDQLKMSYFSPNRSSPRENSPKPCLNRATQLGNRLLRWEHSQIYLVAFSHALLMQTSSSAQHQQMALCKHFMVWPLKALHFIWQRCLQLSMPLLNPGKQNNFSMYTRTFQNGQMRYWRQANGRK